MRAAIGIRDRIGKWKNLVVVTVVILQHDIDKDFVALARDYDRLWVDDSLFSPSCFTNSSIPCL